MPKKSQREAYAVVCCPTQGGFIVRVISREEDDIGMTITAEQDCQQRKKSKVSYGDVIRVDTADADNGAGSADILEIISEKDIHSLEKKGEIHPRAKWEHFIGKSAKDKIQQMKSNAIDRNQPNANDCGDEETNAHGDDDGNTSHIKGAKKSLTRAEKRELHEKGVRGYAGNGCSDVCSYDTSNTSSPSLLAKCAVMDEKLGDALLDDL